MQSNRHKSHGFSLIEVMVTLILGIVVVAMVIQLFINTKTTHARNDRVSETLESGRYALRQLATDLKEAGFFAGVIDSSTITDDSSLTNVATDCGSSGQTNWAYDLTNYRGVQFDTNTSSNTTHTCISSSYLQPSSDILAIKRVADTPLSTTAAVSPLAIDNVYLRSDYSTACLWYYDGSSANPSGSSCPAASVTTKDWQYIVHIYYIRSYDTKTTDGIPTLCRETLEGSANGPTMTNVCLAPGVEHFHVMFGIDTTGDGVADQFISAPTATQLNTQVVSARIYVLARSTQADRTFTNDTTYELGDPNYTYTESGTAAKYYHRLYSTTVILRNPMYAAAFQ